MKKRWRKLSLVAAVLMGCTLLNGCGKSAVDDKNTESTAAISEDAEAESKPDADPTSENEEVQEEKEADAEPEEIVYRKNADGYISVSMSEGLRLMSEDGSYLIVDVRTWNEYHGGHIPRAVCIPTGEIVDQEPVLLPNKEQRIYVYCRSGARSKDASAKLAAMGYTNIIEFGGINDYIGDRAVGYTFTRTEDRENDTVRYMVTDGLREYELAVYHPEAQALYLTTDDPSGVGYAYTLFKEKVGTELKSLTVTYAGTLDSGQFVYSASTGMMEIFDEYYEVVESEPYWLEKAMTVERAVDPALQDCFDAVAEELL